MLWKGDIKHLAWPANGLGVALEGLGRQGGCSPRPGIAAPPPPRGVERDGEALGQWVGAAAKWLGLEAESHLYRYGEAERLVAGNDAPTLVRLPGEGEPSFLALVQARKAHAVLFCPDLTLRRVDPEALRAALCRTSEETVSGEVESLLDEMGVVGRRRARARAALLGQLLGDRWVGEFWSLRPSPATPLGRRAARARLPRRLALFVTSHVAQYALWLLAWWVIGRAALGGTLEGGWLILWGLLLLTMVPLRLLATWSAGVLAVGAGGLLKQHLLHGALKLEPEEIRSEGVGYLLGRVFEGDAVETLALNGGLTGLVAVIELSLAALVLAAGAGGLPHVALLAVWSALAAALGWAYYRRRLAWTDSRLALTHDLVEAMTGHRTRLAQQHPERWHEGEDRSLENYLVLSSRADRAAALLAAAVPRGWLVLGVCGLGPAFVYGGDGEAALAVGLGGVLLAHRALAKLTESLASLAGAGIAWRKVSPLFKAAGRPEQVGVPSFVVAPAGAAGGDRVGAGNGGGGTTVVEARELVYRYRGRDEPVLRDCSLRVAAGDRLLLRGASGGGKSTLASLLTGMRVPDSGLILLGGLDRHTLGLDGWRRRVVAAPQFHENHVLTGSFAFNLLMGRRWPPRAEDLEEAEAVCRELGLGELLERMPGGFEQMVGESGWQLSHGERSRLFIARALVQRADLLVLDESFAALDPENLRRALDCVLRRAPTVLVIAHP